MAPALTRRTFATETIAPYANAPEIKIPAEITKYDDATEKRMAALATSESETSPYHPSNLFKDPEAGDVPKWSTDFWKIVREKCVH
eukprot:CAMPEP_0114508116 /NCGR_PEP_ID=MMETSP0109-20121206/12408_1 /TAXON_ID=29199 /ORGANISM="Chlorarachnion reptans, Strain CCCM449" /LENGTH=85 /DNA_ID=CAMNT_0001686987 /DNA_START=83 /DNA_END=340 /DNA_ORIENTATION=+